MKHYHLIGFFCVFLGLTGCKSKQPDFFTYELRTRSFVEKIHGTGTLESAKNFTIVAPAVMGSSIKVASLAPEGTLVQKGDTVCTLNAPDIQGYYDRYDDELMAARADLVKQEAKNAVQLSLLNAQILMNKARMEITQLDSVQIKFAPPVQKRIMELEQEKNDITKKKLVKKLEAERKINEQTVRAIKSQIIQKEQLVQRFQDQLDMLIITAPKSGMLIYASSPMVMFMDGSGNIGSSGGDKIKIGSIVRRRMPLIELPDLENMQVKLMVQEGDFKRIEEGQQVVIQPDALDKFITTGTIAKKSLASQKLAYKFKVKSYTVIIDIDSLDNMMLPGLSANCEIIVHDIQDTIVVPSISIFEKDSIKVVYVSKGEYFVPEPVETGLINSALTIISAGLTGNETIALMEPPMKYVQKLKKIKQ
ncbi:MAG: hypothetical protein U9N86_06850 [Bacteroidota bacterium]|nr:hypothetical protein [Bacteroidota bacterium]